MGNKLKKAKKKLKTRQDDYDATVRTNPAFKRPGSMNTKRQNTAGTVTGGHR